MITHINTMYGSLEEDLCKMSFDDFVRLRLDSNYRLAESLSGILVNGRDEKELRAFFDMVRRSR